MEKLKLINSGIFPGNILFSYMMTYDDIIRELGRLHGDRSSDSEWIIGISMDEELIDSDTWLALSRTISSETKDSISLFYILIPDEFQFNDEDYIKLAHEVTHICAFILTSILDRDREIEAELLLVFIDRCIVIWSG